ECDTDARRDADLDAGQQEWRSNCGADPRGNAVDLPAYGNLGTPVEVFAEHDELVARHPCQRVSRTQFGTQSSRDRHEQLVADSVSVRVVHQLESIEIDEENRGGPARTDALMNRVV